MDDYKLIISPIINGLKDKNLNNYNSTAPDAGHSGGLDGTKLQTKMRLFQQDPSACPREMFYVTKSFNTGAIRMLSSYTFLIMDSA